MLREQTPYLLSHEEHSCDPLVNATGWNHLDYYLQEEEGAHLVTGNGVPANPSSSESWGLGAWLTSQAS